MRPQTQPNHWSCAVTAAAIVMDMAVSDLISEIGHDGSAIVFPELPAPICRAGFDIQEIIDVALRHGWYMVPIEARPIVTNDGVHTRSLFAEDKISPRMERYFSLYSGVVMGERKFGRKWWHTCAWDHVTQLWYDPSGPILPYGSPPIDIRTFWIFRGVYDG